MQDENNAEIRTQNKKTDRKKLRSKTGLWDKDMSRVPHKTEPIG